MAYSVFVAVFMHNVTYIYYTIISRVKCVACAKLLMSFVLLLLLLSVGVISAVMSASLLFGPYSFDIPLNQTSYFRMLQKHPSHDNIQFHLDGGPVNFSIYVLEFLGEICGFSSGHPTAGILLDLITKFAML